MITWEIAAGKKVILKLKTGSGFQIALNWINYVTFKSYYVTFILSAAGILQQIFQNAIKINALCYVTPLNMHLTMNKELLNIT